MSEKTEQPTPKRLRESREKGDICKSQDVVHAATVLVLAVYVTAAAGEVWEKLVTMVNLPMTLINLPYDEALSKASAVVWECAAGIVLPVVGVAMGAAVAALLGQTGFLFAPKAAAPKLENLSPGKWVKKVFSMKNLFELMKNLLKVTVLGLTAWWVLSKFLPTLFEIPRGGTMAMWRVMGEACSELLLVSAGAFAVIAALDYLYQRYKWNTEHMMSIEEVKREYKESEGDPMVKNQRKQLHRELLNQNAVDNVRRAKVLVVNPTHFAVALDYDREKTPLPVILAKGEGNLALRMIEAAKEAGVPVMRNVPLARALYSEGTENGYIPRDLIGPVAEVLRWVQSLDGARN